MIKRQNSNILKRKIRTRGKIANPDRPKLSVFRSNKSIYAQIISDGNTLAWASGAKTVESAAKVGSKIAANAIKKGVKDVIFDRGAYKFHGRVKALAQAAREGGLNF